MHSNITAPPPDPIPWATAQFRRAGVFDQSTDEGHRAKAALEALTRNVSALHDDGGVYRVILDKACATAGTFVKERLVQVGAKPLYDTSLTEGQQTAVLMGLVLHEVGHIRYSRDYTAALKRSDVERTGAVGAISNLTADHHNERAAMDLFPGLAYAVEVAMWWVAREMPTPEHHDLLTVAGRVNAAIAVTRYPWAYDWAQHPEWSAWWTDWAERAEQQGKPKQHADLVAEAMAMVRDLPPEPEPEPEDGEPCPQGDPDPDAEPEDGDDEGDDETPTHDPDDTDGDPDDDGDDDEGGESGDDEGTDEGDPEDGTDDGTDGDDGDDPTDDGDDPTGSGESPDWSDEPDEGEGDDGDADETTDGTSEGDAPTDGEDGDDESDGGTESDSSSDEQGSTGTPRDDESGEGIEEPCASKAARDEDIDTALQGDVNAIMRSERMAAGVHHYQHSTSKYGRGTFNQYGERLNESPSGRTAVIARKSGKHFTN